MSTLVKRLAILFFLAIPASAFGQIGVDFHFSSVPFFGVHYELWERVRPELRFGTDSYMEDIGVELIATYDILKKTDYEFYAGLGLRSDPFTGVVVPVGMNFYPFEVRKFGFHFEVAPVIASDDSSILRGSLGIRYRFLKGEPVHTTSANMHY